VRAVRFGDFTLGRTTVHSPVYINVRRIISQPRVLKRAVRFMSRELAADQQRLHPRFEPFHLVAGIPFGGLHIATAFSLSTNTPLIYTQPRGDNRNYVIEGTYEPDQSVLLLDDLITTGGSVLETAALLREEGLRVHDIMVLVDRGVGATARLRQQGYSLYSVLTLEVMLNYYLSTGRIDEALHRKCCEYIVHQRETYGES
jgi:orotate phosphoribosyltransferase/uridine monophosphate synthetase